MAEPHLALVTGASRGTGRAIARRLASEGIAVAVVARTLRPGDGALAGSLEDAVDLIRRDGGTAEAALALCTADPVRLTGRVAYSLPLLHELGRPVRTLDGRSLLAGWQPADLDASGFLAEHLRFVPPPPLPEELLAVASSAGGA